MDIGSERSPIAVKENHNVDEETLFMWGEYKFFCHGLKGQYQKKSRRILLRDV
jgi:hypothetical protein